MKRVLTLSVVVSTLLLATNGDIMIGNGAKSTSMGGAGIALNHGSEVVNPAMLGELQGSEVSGSLTYFSPDVQFRNSMNPASDFADSEAGSSLIPTLAYAKRVNDRFVYGVSVVGAAGMGVDYVNKTNGAFNMKTELQIARISLPMAYSFNQLTVGIEPVVQYGKLQMNYATMMGESQNPESESIDFGFNAGVAYKVDGFTFGALYKSAIEAEYKDNIGNGLRDFNVASVITSGDVLEQPAEMGIGVAYTQGASTIAVDYKTIKWGDATGYKDYGWEDQNVIAVGYRYQGEGMALKLGYNHGKNPIAEQNAQGMVGYVGAATNFFNIAGFPAIVEEHYTVGVDYELSKNLALTSAFVYSPEVEESYDISALSQAFGAGEAEAQVKHSQMAFTVGAVYRF
jgi:long-chain fatty acid transport protein